MSEDFYDFDAAWAEQAAIKAPPTIKVFGETITLPPSVPASLYLYRERLKNSEAPVTLSVIMDFVRHFVGDRVDAWVNENGMTDDQLFDMSDRINKLYEDDTTAEDEAGEAQAPEAGATEGL